ncbi:MAG: aldehyde ferredoxin oxidoreductase family protein [Deltaproteobacteria bacterium]|nr:aldehyde ferredoxin oxidoreductase family protein [Deltaproteobacteria bacterium]
MKGFYHRILIVDLHKRSFQISPLSDDIPARYLGGKGLGSYLLYHHNMPGIDPLGPSNCLIFATGPATGSLLWGSSRYGVFTKSPQTGFYTESYSGGKVPEAVDAAGFDAVIITGAADSPTVLTVNPDGALFHDGAALWGMETYAAEDAVHRLFAGKNPDYKRSGAVVIGPAGEHLVRFAVIENDYWRSAGRTGVGAVMGSKKLKGILFEGNRKRELFDAAAVREYAKKFTETNRDSNTTKAYKSMGTSQMVKVMNQANAFPTRYWTEGKYDRWEAIGADALHEKLSVMPRACLKCFMACGRLATVKEGRHQGLKIEGPEYETIYAFGGLCLIDKIEEIAYLNDLCDRLGMDTISAGNLCAFSIEAAKRGKINYAIDYGDVDAIAGLLKMMAARQGIGAVLAEGIRFAADQWDMADMAVHVKGLEPAGYDPRVLKGMGLGYAVSDRGACHLRATFYKPELSGMIAADAVEGKAKLFLDFEDRLTLFDTMIFCRFFRDFYTWDELGQMIRMTTGLPGDRENLQRQADAIANLVRHFNIREGLTMKDDQLPKHLYRQLEKTAHQITEKEMAFMIGDYYRLRGWDENGVPPPLK